MDSGFVDDHDGTLRIDAEALADSAEEQRTQLAVMVRPDDKQICIFSSGQYRRNRLTIGTLELDRQSTALDPGGVASFVDRTVHLLLDGLRFTVQRRMTNMENA